MAIVLALPAGASELVLGDAFPSAEIVIIGEQHDHAEHHENQALIVSALAPKALVFEMLSPEQIARADGVDPADAQALEAAFGWNASGWPEFELYHPIFAAAPDTAWFGAALPRAQVRAAISEGAAKVFGPDAERFGLLSELPDDQQTAREDLQMAAHCDALPPEMLSGMVEAQRLRDAHFARVALDALDRHGAPVIVITGNGHARTDWGIPYFLRIAAPQTTVLSIGQVSGDVDVPFDRWITTNAFSAPGDPCAAFKSN